MPFTITASVASSPIQAVFYLPCEPICEKKNTIALPLFSPSMLIILCNINYSDQPVLILALILVNIRNLQKPSSILVKKTTKKKTIDSTRFLTASGLVHTRYVE